MVRIPIKYYILDPARRLSPMGRDSREGDSGAIVRRLQLLIDSYSG